MNSLFRSLRRSNFSRRPASAVLWDAVRSSVEPLERRALLSATISVNDINGPETSHTVSVTYTDADGVDLSTIDASDLNVSGPKPVAVSLVSATPGSDATTVNAVYSLAGPDGSWDASDAGGYGITIPVDQVKDSLGNNLLDQPESANFDVSFPPPPDTTAPDVSISVGNVTGTGSTHTVSVTYSDPSGIKNNTIDKSDITVTRNSDGAQLEVSDASPSGSSTSRTVVYTVKALGGSWDESDNGGYTVTVKAGAVQDNSPQNNGVAETKKAFSVNVPPPADVNGPLGEVTGENVTTAKTSTIVNVTYVDDRGIDTQTVSPDNIQVTFGATVSDAKVTSVSDGGKTVVVAYTVVGPGGGFDVKDNGTEFRVTDGSKPLKDTSGNAAGVVPDFFGVNIPLPDLLAPTAAFSAIGDVTSGGAASFNVVVTYTDETAMNPDSVGPSDLTFSKVGGGDAGMSITGVSKQVSADGKSVTATYTVSAPGGSFDAADNGTYSIGIAAGQVRDAAGNGAVGVPVGLGVNITTPTPTPTDNNPTAVITGPDVNSPGGSTTKITVVYTDDGKIKAGTIGEDDIVVTRGGTTLQVTDVKTTSSDGGSKVTAVYTVAAPGGTWDAADNGTYGVTLAAGAVTDTKNNPVGGAAAEFTVNASASDGDAPTAGGISVGDVTAEGVRTVVVTVTYTDDLAIDKSSIGTGDVSISGPAGSLAVNVVDVSASDDGRSATVTYTFAAPAGGFTFEHNGAYTVTLADGSVKDSAGKGVAGKTATFQVALPEPTPVDVGFGNGSAVNTSFMAEALATSLAGKVFVAGHDASGHGIIEVRNADGTLDKTFNKTGQLVSTTDTGYFAVVAQGDKIVVGGTINGDFVLVRYLGTGQFDSSFGKGGRMVVDFGQNNDSIYALALAPDGKIVAAGQSDGNFAFARYDADGRLDPTFGSGGITLFDLGGSDLAGAVVVQPDGKIVAAGLSGNQVAVVRLQANGLEDSTAAGSASPFSGDGLLMVTGLVGRDDSTVQDRSAALALQSDGKILVGNHTASGDFGIARITPAGNIDSGFGGDGIATADFGGDDDADALIVQPTGEILAIGTSLSGNTGSTNIAAFSSSGQLITTFANGGKLVLDSGVVSSGRELHVGDLVLRAFGTRQSDGRVVVGTSNGTPQTQTQSALRRLNVPGTRSQPSGTQIGTFGIVSGSPKSQKLTYTDADGTKITFTIKGGTGTAFLGNDGKINLVLSDGGTGGMTVGIKGAGGDGRVALGDISASGTIKGMAAKNSDLSGAFCISGSLGKLAMGNFASGASLCSAGNIASVLLASMTGAKILAGANLGADAAFGGTGASVDSYGAGSIGTLKVAGEINGSTIGAGLDPVDATFGNEDDALVDGPATSFVKSISAKAADPTSRFLAGAFSKVKIGAKVDPATDPRFRILQ